MPKCQNPECGKTGLSPQEVIYNLDQDRVLCRVCDEQRRLFLSEIVEEQPDIKYRVSFGNEEGLRASLKIGEVKLEATASYDQVKKLIKGDG